MKRLDLNIPPYKPKKPTTAEYIAWLESVASRYAGVSPSELWRYRDTIDFMLSIRAGDYTRGAGNPCFKSNNFNDEIKQKIVSYMKLQVHKGMRPVDVFDDMHDELKKNYAHLKTSKGETPTSKTLSNWFYKK